MPTTEELLKVNWEALPLEEQIKYAEQLLERMQLLVDRISANCRAVQCQPE